VNESLLEGRSSYKACPEFCDRPDMPGMTEVERFLDASRNPTTIDQAEIEEAMDAEGVSGLAIMHVGVGNSSLAKRFAGRASRITGLTISQNEMELADSLSLPGYKVYLLNKYSSGLASATGAGYDLIVDNNLASFACCKTHFFTLLNSYSECLTPGGRILTHQRGMSWSAGDPRWKLTFGDLEELGKTFPFRAARITDAVYSLTRTS
jgi:hypothetical protein